MNPNINNISSFLTSIAEGHLYQSFYHQRMGLLRLGLVSECRVTKNTTNDTNFSHTFFHILNIMVDYFKSTRSKRAFSSCFVCIINQLITLSKIFLSYLMLFQFLGTLIEPMRQRQEFCLAWTQGPCS